MKRPSSVRVGCHTFHLIDKKVVAKETLGEMDVLLNTITLPIAATPTRQLELILHEVFHACFSGFDSVRKATCEEVFCLVMGERMASFIVDNPEFLRWAMSLRPH